MSWKYAFIGFIAIFTILTVSACENSNTERENASQPSEVNITNVKNSNEIKVEKNDSVMDEIIPKGLRVAANPTFQIGSKAYIHTAHKAGMEGAKATIVGAYDTIAYTVSFIPTTGEGKISNHKWVIHEEIKGADKHPFSIGEEVILEADHMKGMRGATATINSINKTTVYMINYVSTITDKKVTNHKWVVEDELSAID
ncbi:YdhK family protein [Oceanobacillus senegalensis]|uniref:YdhK family protein n=1 Tax=Oceanobacillus senegalensis TaxID=1936063 RepID=UPI000A30940B|nr:YdhK family protein [Oceanobacillus senegalensis]